MNKFYIEFVEEVPLDQKTLNCSVGWSASESR